MFGQDGSSKTAKLLHQMTSLWKKRHRYVLGIFCRNDIIYVIRLENTGEHWELNENAMIPFSLEAEDEPYRMEMAAEKVVAMLQVMGWQAAPIALCLSEQEVFHDILHLPDMPPTEIAEAIHWELDAQRDFTETGFLSAFLPSPDAEGQWAAAVPKSLADAWKSAWQKNGLELAALTVMPAFLKMACHIDDMDLQIREHRLHAVHAPCDSFYEDGGWEALYAAEILCFPDPHALNFLGRSAKTDWNWKKLSIAVSTAVAIGLFSCFLTDQIQLHTAQETLAEQKSQLALLSNAQKEKELLETAASNLQRKNEQLVRLSKDSFPWRGIFVHLGTMTVDGVWLSDISMPKPYHLDLQGKAICYDALAEFLQKFESDRDFFPEAPILKSSELESSASHPSTVSFHLELNLASGEEHHADAG